jgi:hypothetical protein
MALPPRLERELEELRASSKLEIVEDAEVVNLLFRDFPVGEGFNVPACDLLIRIPRSYPDAGPDMFWTTPELALSDGRVPQSAESVEVYLGRQWRRFSWHRSHWNSSLDNIHGYLEFVRRRLRHKQ